MVDNQNLDRRMRLVLRHKQTIHQSAAVSTPTNRWNNSCHTREGGCNPIAKSGSLILISVFPAKAGTQGFQSPALGPRFRGDDELSCPQDFLTASKAGVHAHAALSRSVVSRTIVGGCPPDGTRVSAGNC